MGMGEVVNPGPTGRVTDPEHCCRLLCIGGTLDVGVGVGVGVGGWECGGVGGGGDYNVPVGTGSTFNII